MVTINKINETLKKKINNKDILDLPWTKNALEKVENWGNLTIKDITIDLNILNEYLTEYKIKELIDFIENFKEVKNFKNEIPKGIEKKFHNYKLSIIYFKNGLYKLKENEEIKISYEEEEILINKFLNLVNYLLRKRATLSLRYSESIKYKKKTGIAKTLKLADEAKLIYLYNLIPIDYNFDNYKKKLPIDINRYIGNRNIEAEKIEKIFKYARLGLYPDEIYY